MAGEVALDRALQGLEEWLKAERTVVDGEGSLAHGVVEATDSRGFIGLARADHDGDGRELQSTQQLQDPMAGSVLVLLVHRDGEVDDGDVDPLLLDEDRRLTRGARHAAAHSHRLKERGQGPGDRLCSPHAIVAREEHVEAVRNAGLSGVD